MLFSKQIQKFLKSFIPAKLYHRTMYNTQCGFKNLNSSQQNQGQELKLMINDVYQRAYESFLDENYEESAKSFKQLKKLDPHNIHNQINYSIALQKSNKPYDGLKAIKKALSMIDGNQNKGQQQNNQQDTSVLQQNIIAPNPFLKSSALAVKAQCLASLNQIDDAIKIYEEAASLNNQQYLSLGNFCFEQKRLHKALVHLLKAASTKNQSLNEVMISIIKTLYELRLFKACFELSEKYLFIFHNQYEGMYFAGKSCYQLNNKEKARKYLEMAVVVAPQQFEPVIALSKLLREQGECQEALNILQKFLNYDCSQAEIYLEAAESLIKLNRKDNLIDYLQQSLKLNQKCLRTHILLGENLTNLQEKIKIIDIGLIYFPDSHELHFLKSTIHQQLNNTALQIRELEKCLSLLEQNRNNNQVECQYSFKYPQQLIQAITCKLQEEQINPNEQLELQSKLNKIKLQYESYFQEKTINQKILSALEVKNSSTDLSTLLLNQTDLIHLVKAINKINLQGGIHFLVGLEYAKRNQHQQSQHNLEQIEMFELPLESQIIINFLQFHNLFEQQDYQRSLEKINVIQKQLESNRLSEQLIADLKQMAKETNLGKSFTQMEGLQDVKQFCQEQIETLAITMKLKQVFPQF
ncbi:tetratricopeptide repeat protein (macronuclear) [Tetrahymena thermophila SB210]|uniref:Tetratricopeptide repeat protein n=1 Tax=Tetrahymena thermophila (strain SB210) TaxID=312017 RepID=I7LT05_TETTS|nr:tetratricopeptide repeat protein [Tetrahymena thermophila SB210]EAR84010.2 tetratricopeptide repeat protein [Tetrahymena thermophila SB210]|eukprot:XP_001031673.2 tetratricopeptide repeat protein [Tetrahymena thermophila SB210]